MSRPNDQEQELEHSFYNSELKTSLVINETFSPNICISIEDIEKDITTSHYLNQKTLRSLIGVLLHIQQSKSKKGGKND